MIHYQSFSWGLDKIRPPVLGIFFKNHPWLRHPILLFGALVDTLGVMCPKFGDFLAHRLLSPAPNLTLTRITAAMVRKLNTRSTDWKESHAIVSNVPKVTNIFWLWDL